MSRGRADIDTCVAELAEALAGHGWMLATAESCTGGLIAGACTERPGSSAWFDRGFVTYSNEAKVELLGVPPALIRAHGAVSEPVAMAMAQGALARSLAHWAVAVTGVAGPGGGSPDKPVGTVWLAWAYRPLPGPTPALGREGGVACRADAERHLFAGDRFAVREQTVLLALQGLLARTRAVR